MQCIHSYHTVLHSLEYYEVGYEWVAPSPTLRMEFGPIAGPSLEVGGGNIVEIIIKIQLKCCAFNI